MTYDNGVTDPRPPIDSGYRFERGRYGVDLLYAPYELLTRAFGNDGTVSPRDDWKSMAEWGITTPHGQVEVYDYKVGTCYDRAGLAREDITEWHVQGDEEAVAIMLNMVRDADTG